MSSTTGAQRLRPDVVSPRNRSENMGLVRLVRPLEPGDKRRSSPGSSERSQVSHRNDEETRVSTVSKWCLFVFLWNTTAEQKKWFMDILYACLFVFVYQRFRLFDLACVLSNLTSRQTGVISFSKCGRSAIADQHKHEACEHAAGSESFVWRHHPSSTVPFCQDFPNRMIKTSQPHVGSHPGALRQSDRLSKQSVKPSSYVNF